MEHSTRHLHLPKRETQKVMLTLAVDQIEFLDTCAKAVGQSRSGFLSLMIDGFYEEIIAFARGYATRIIEQATITEHRKNKTGEKQLREQEHT
jgi:hypothetical protein